MPITNLGLSTLQVNQAISRGRGGLGAGFASPAAINRKSSFANPIAMNVEIQGLNAVADHWFAVAEFTHNGAGAIVDFTGQLLTNLAKEIHRPHILSEDTFKSISVTEEGTVYDGLGWQVEVGPETPQAKFLEWGFLHQPDGAWIQYPFMIPAAETIAPLFHEAIGQVAAIAAITAPLAGTAGAARNALDAVRDRLYSTAKFLGDIQILGISTPSALRTGLLSAAQLAGDVQSAVRGSIGRRITVRAFGRFSSGALTASTSATVTGPSSSYQSGANRVYNRVVGRVSSQSFLQRL